jgi:hypothetical protein
MLVERFNGGTKWMGLAGIIGIIGVAISIWGFLAQPQLAYYGWLSSFVYWFGMSAGALLLLLIFHVMGAKWPTVLRRPIEAMSGALPVFVLLFIPIVLGMKVLFPWTDPEANFNPVQMHHFHGAKHTYLDTGFFLVRQVIYFGVFLVVSELLLAWSRKQDDEGGYEWNRKSRKLAAGAIPFVALALTWASFDWIMSLTPFWQQTLFGVYYFSGAFLSAIAMLTLVSVMTRKDRQLFGAWLTKHHEHNLGKLLLAFTGFWAYIAFSQFMLVWIANLPEETPYYMLRMNEGWAGMSTFLIVGHFVLPFLLLVARTTKLIPSLMAAVSLWLLIVCAVDDFWLVMPALQEEGPTFNLFYFSSFLGIGGLAIAFSLWRVKGRHMLPVKDPYLEDSLRYAQP